jgi:hypothetical protein
MFVCLFLFFSFMVHIIYGSLLWDVGPSYSWSGYTERFQRSVLRFRAVQPDETILSVTTGAAGGFCGGWGGGVDGGVVG